MPKPKGLLNKYLNVFLWIVVLAAIIYLIVRNIGAFGNVLLVVLGFGAVVLVHEFGHFIIAKLSGIKVEAFWIFMPPMLLGMQKTENGLRFRLLPKFFPKENDESGDGRLSFTFGKKATASDTEYRIGLVPFGGFVKMLGQDDTGPAKASDDPRSFANKPVTTRMAVITAGVVFNAISAIIIFMTVFLIGINLTPPVVGAVAPNSPAARAGLRPGDEIIEIAGESDNLDFSNIAIAAALSDVNEVVPLKARHADGSIEDFDLVAEQLPGMQMKLFGVLSPQSLTIAEVSDTNELLAKTGLLPGDLIKAISGKDIQAHWELEKIVEDALVPEVTILAERTNPISKKAELVESQIRLDLNFAYTYDVNSESELYHIHSMVPRLRITTVVDKPASIKDRLISFFNKMGIVKKVADIVPHLQKGDIILAVNNVDNPTYKEIREVIEKHEAKELLIKILRVDANDVEKTPTVTVVPRRRQDIDRVEIGIGVTLDAEHPVVAKTIAAENGPAKLEIPRGAVITAVDGTDVSSFYDIVREIRRNVGQRITIDYRLADETAGDVTFDVDAAKGSVTVKSTFGEFVPFDNLKRLYKASDPIDAIRMGYKKTLMFIAQAYVTLKRLVGGLVSPKELMGPVGIITISYRIVAEQPLIYYVYFLGLISAVIAVFNFLPLPPLDGGLIVLLLVEKIKGSALSERTQEIIAYAGWVLIGSLILYVTFNDIVRSFFR
ncbi:MAG: site-2 protease family protein [Planctomycetota bacterium]|jgi:regulator of sigma E protease